MHMHRATHGLIHCGIDDKRFHSNDSEGWHLPKCNQRKM
jgi:hypothetical protein